MKTIFCFTRSALLILALTVSLIGFHTLPAEASTYTVKMGTDSGKLAFEPSQLNIQPGDTVAWVNNKVYPHNVVFEAKDIPTKDINLAKQLSTEQLIVTPNQEISVTFPEDVPTGEYSYFCMPHRGAGMVGKILVEPKV